MTYYLNSLMGLSSYSHHSSSMDKTCKKFIELITENQAPQNKDMIFKEV